MIQQHDKEKHENKERSGNMKQLKTPVKTGKSSPKTPPGQLSRIKNMNYFQVLQRDNELEAYAGYVGGRTILKPEN